MAAGFQRSINDSKTLLELLLELLESNKQLKNTCYSKSYGPYKLVFCGQKLKFSKIYQKRP